MEEISMYQDIRCIGDPVKQGRLAKGPSGGRILVMFRSYCGSGLAEPALTPNSDLNTTRIWPPQGPYASLPCVAGSPVHLDMTLGASRLLVGRQATTPSKEHRK